MSAAQDAALDLPAGAEAGSAPRRPAYGGAGFFALSIVLTAAAMGLAAAAWWPIHRHPALITLATVSITLGCLIAATAAWRRWSAPVTVAATALAFLAAGVPLAVPGEAVFGLLPSSEGLIDLIAGVVLGWKQLATIALPVGDYEALLVPAFTTLLLGTVLTLTLALRTRAGSATALVPLAAFLTGIAFGPERTELPLWLPAVLLVLLLLWTAWLRGRRITGSPSRRLRSALRAAPAALLVLAVVAAVGVVGADRLAPASARTTVRTVVAQPFDPRDHVSPLAGFRSFWMTPRVDEVLLVVEGLPQGRLLRLAVLDTWDGVVYTVGTEQLASASGTFTRVPGRIDQSGTPGQLHTVRVRVAGYDDVWLPTIGALVSAEPAEGSAAGPLGGLHYNAVTGSAAVVSPLAAGDAYALTAVLAEQPDAGELSRLSPGSGAVPPAAAVPAELIDRLERYTAGRTTPGARLEAMLRGLAAEGFISHGVSAQEPPSRSGHSADRLARFFAEARLIGDAEQYAVAAALMARELGFPARVVLGFLPRTDEVRGSDVTAWIEVSTAEHGWVLLDPNPPPREIPDEAPEEAAAVARPQTVVPPPQPSIEDVNRQATPDAVQQEPDALDPALQALLAGLAIAGWVLAGLAVLAAPAFVVLAAKNRRRRLRRDSGSTAERIAGGWREFEDALLDRGHELAPAATRTEVAEDSGLAPAAELARLADRACFAPDEPGEQAAVSAWLTLSELTAGLDAGLGRRQRLRARLSLRSLGGVNRGARRGSPWLRSDS